MPKSPVFIFIFSLLIMPLFSLEETNNADAVNSIEIIGLKRTKLHVAKYPLEKFIGMERAAFNQSEVFAAVMNTGILDPVSAELIEDDDGLIMRVTVEEKWSIFPVPFFFAGSGEINYGLFCSDINTFGLRDMAVIGGMYGSNGWMALALYNHTPDRHGTPGWNVFFMYTSHEIKNTDRDENIYCRYTADKLRFSFGMNYGFLGFITASINFSFSNIAIKDSNEDLNPPENGAMFIGFNSGISLRKSSWDGIFLSNRSISLDYGYNLAISGSSYNEIGINGSYGYSFLPGFRLIIRGGAVWKSASNILFEESPISQIGILPRSYSAMNYAGISAGVEKHIFVIRWGTLSIQSSWQGIFSHRQNSDWEFDHGPSAGINFYLSRIALPAIGVGAAYNIVSGLFQFNFSIGMSF